MDKGFLFTNLMTYGGALVALFNPYYGLLIYVCFAVIRPEFLWPWSVEPGNYSRIVAVALLIGWVLKGCGNWHFGRARGVVAALAGFLVWALVAMSFAPDRDLAWRYVDNIAKIVLPFLVGITMIDSVAKLKQLAWVLLLSQGYLAFEFNDSYFAGVNRLRADGFGGMDNNSQAIALVSCVGLAFFLGLQSERLWQKVLAFGLGLLMVHAILFSFSRGGMLALAVTGAASFLLIPKKVAHYVLFAAAVLIAVRLAGPEVVERFRTTFAEAEQRDDSADSRVQLWKACLDSMGKRPLGVGPDNFGEYMPEYGFPRGKKAHSLWLQVGAELGVPGLTFLVLFYGLCVWRLFPLTREKTPVPDPWFRGTARMVIASLVGFAVAAQFVSLDRLEIPYYVVLIGAGLLKIAPARAAVSSRSAVRPALAAVPSYS